ncbi:MAG: SDR family NAD(P)-dependent oxidoreductase [Ancalomicrobiaceae bacterium]|nr:SDR family NAD(P)-dependent oxidoreductase [Ancalomicrobiaceae bacterium]
MTTIESTRSAADAAFAGTVAVVTGASRGIGYTVARELARAGSHVVALARTQGGLEELDDEVRGFGGGATLVPIDLRDFDALDRLGAALFERWGRVDMLVGNAGVLGPISPVGHVAPKDWDEVMAVNVTANWRLIRSLDPLLRASPAGRALFITSGAVLKRRAFWGPYSVSKAALEALVVTYAREVAISPVKVNLFNPGPIRTAMRARALPGEDPDTLQRAEVLVPDIFAALSPALSETGRVYDFPTKCWRD